MRKRRTFSERLGGLERVEGVAAVPPRPDRSAGDAAAPAEGVTDALPSKDAESFRSAGWSFVERSVGEAAKAARAVFKDGDGNVKIDSGSLNVRFAKGLSEDEIARFLHDRGLTIRRQLGFAPNLFTVSGQGDAKADSVEVARSLEDSDKVEYAEPVLIEALAGR